MLQLIPKWQFLYEMKINKLGGSYNTQHRMSLFMIKLTDFVHTFNSFILKTTFIWIHASSSEWGWYWRNINICPFNEVTDLSKASCRYVMTTYTTSTPYWALKGDSTTYDWIMILMDSFAFMGLFFHEIISKVIFYTCIDIKINILILCIKALKFIV